MIETHAPNWSAFSKEAGRLQQYLSHLTVFGQWLLWVRFVREVSSFLKER